MKHIKNLQNLTSEAKDLLLFSPDQLAMVLGQEGSFSPLCVPPKYIKVLIKNKEKAHVFEKEPKVIYFDCTTVKKEEWHTLFDSERAEDIGFFIHEGLRLIGQNDDNSALSSSIYPALKQEEKNKTTIVSKLLNGNVGACHSYIGRSPSNGYDYLVIKKGDIKIYSIKLTMLKQKVLVPDEEVGLVKSKILFRTDYPATEIGDLSLDRKFLYKLLEYNGCLTDQ